MKLLLVNGTFEGGSLISTRELLHRLPERNVEARLIRAEEGSAAGDYLQRRSTNLAVKLGGAEPSNVIERGNRQRGRRPHLRGPAEWSSVAVENASRTILDEWSPDVVVVSSVLRVPWRRLRRDTTERGIPCFLYLREEALLAHLDLGADPDRLLANSQGLVDQARKKGWEADLIPSIVNLEECAADSERTKILVINPTPPYGLDLAVRLAERRPDLGFVFQESTRLTSTELTVVQDVCARLPNVEFRPFCNEPAHIYRDARVLLAPYTEVLESNRPRSVLEAQFNGIPIVGTQRGGLANAVGPGGILLSPEAPVESWSDTLEWLTEDDDAYQGLVDAAFSHSRRPEVDPDHVADGFVTLMADLVRRHG